MSAQSYIQIDSFTMNNLFQFIPGPPVQKGSDQRALTGAMHTFVLYFRDTAKVTIPRLTASQYYTLNQICQQTGLNAQHTIIYAGQGPGGVQQIRKYDGTTAYASGYGINDDVARKRAKCRITSFTFTHWPGQSNIFSAELELEEA